LLLIILPQHCLSYTGTLFFRQFSYTRPT